MRGQQRDLYQNILCKFMLNLPREQQQDITRLSYHAEKAFYYYIDEVLADKNIKDWDKQRSDFLQKLKQYCPNCLKISPQHLVTKMIQNKPVCGAIIFNSDNSKILMVRVRSKWGFPKGKSNQNERSQECAIREVYQQTGINIENKLDSRVKIQFDMHGGLSTFFVARGVCEAERIKIDSKQIDQITWMRVQQIRKNQTKFVQRSRVAWSFYERTFSGKQSTDMYIPKYSKKDSEIFDYSANPLLGFKLDRTKLFSIIFGAGRQ